MFDGDFNELSIKADDDKSEGIIIVCTNLKIYNVIHRLEKNLKTYNNCKSSDNLAFRRNHKH